MPLRSGSNDRSPASRRRASLKRFNTKPFDSWAGLCYNSLTIAAPLRPAPPALDAVSALCGPRLRALSRAVLSLFAPSLLLLTLLVLASPPARAQYPGGGGYPGSGPGYVPSGGGPNGPYSGGTLTLTNGHGVDAYPYYINGTDQPDFFGNSGGPLGAYGALYDTETPNGQTATANASGTIGYAFTWDGGPNNDPPPPAVIKTETCTVQYGVLNGAGSDGNPLAAAGADPPSPAGSAWACTKYSGIDAPGATLTDSLAGAFASARATGPDGGAASAGVFDTVSYSPVSLQLVGPTPDNSGNLDILIGQHCGASVVGLPTFPSGYAVSYQWSVSGSTFQTWSADTPAIGGNDYNPDASYYVDGPGPLTNSTVSWYWSDLHDEPEVVGCSITITPPPGQGQALYISLAKTVNVFVPDWAATGTGGYVKIGMHQLSGTNLEVFAGPTSENIANGEPSGMNFEASVAFPLPALFGPGSLELVQLVIPEYFYTRPDGSPRYCLDYQIEGLDSEYPFGWDQDATSQSYTGGDSPGFELSDLEMTSVTLKDQFEDYLMYLPPSPSQIAPSSQYVPIAHFVWSVDGSATHPTTGLWSDYASQNNGSDMAGTVTPSGAATEFLESNSFPEWTQINQAGFQPN